MVHENEARVVVLAVLCGPMAAAASGATEALAAPEFMECAKVKGGAFAKGCGKEEHGGGFEREPLVVPSALTGTSGTFVYTAFIPGSGIVADESCDKAKWTGAITGAKTVELVGTLEKCESGGRKCTGVGETTKGDVKFKLDGTLVATDEAETGVGVRLEGAEPEKVIGRVECEGLKRTWEGAVTGEVTGIIGEASKTWGIALDVNSSGEPTIETEGSRETLFQTVTQDGEEETVAAGFAATTTLKTKTEVMVDG